METAVSAFTAWANTTPQTLSGDAYPQGQKAIGGGVTRKAGKNWRLLTYDPYDNRLSDGSGSKTYTANCNKLATVNGQAVTLDAASHITQLRGLSLAWN
jgi:hypothetical protein